MSNEIDRLEIAVEAEARRANRALSGMERRLNKIADSLEKVIGLSSAMDNLGEFDLRGFEKFQNEIDSMMKSVKGLGRKNVSPRVDRSDIKYAAKSLDELYDKFKDVGKNTDLSGSGLSDLQKGLKNAESTAARLNERLDKKISLEGTDKLGKSWESLIYDIQKATNQAEMYHEAISKIKREVPNFTIDRGQTTSSNDNSQKVTRVSSESLGYNPEAMRAVFGEGAESLRSFDDVMKKFGGNSASAAKAINEFEGEMDARKINTYEAQIKRLKTELAELGMKGFKQGDKEYDSVAKKLARVTAEKRKYDKAMMDSANQDSSFKAVQSRLSNISASLKKSWNHAIKFGSAMKNAFLFPVKFGKSTVNILSKVGQKISSITRNVRNMAKAFATPMVQLGKLRNAILGVQKQSNKGMSFGRMLGSSVAFSFIFQGISMIQNAIKEGSDNLTQYSSEYNNSISGIVSSLTYLKNAWAAAFAPIVNVVAPYLQAFVDMVANALNMVGQFFAALTGKGFAVQAKKVWQDYGAGIAGTGGAADDTNGKLKELKKTVLGFDQLNMLTDNSDSGSGSGGSGGSGGGGILPSDMFETIETQSAIADFARRIREAFLAEDWQGLGKILADGINSGLQYLYDAINWKNVGPKITYFCNAFTTTFNSLVTNINWDLMGRTVGAGINTIVNTLNFLITGINWINLGASFASGINGIFYEVQWDNLGQFIGNKFMIIWNTLYGIIGNLDYKTIGISFANGINGIFSSINFVTIGNTLSSGLNGLAYMLTNFTNTVNWEQIAVNLYTGINTFIHNTNWEELGTSLSGFVMELLGTFQKVIHETDWKALGQAIGEFLGSIDWVGILTTVGDIIWTAFSGVISGLFDTSAGKVFLAFVGGLTAIKGVFGLIDLSADILEWITKASNTFGGFGDLIKTGVIPKIGEGISLITGEGGLFSKIATAAAGVVSKAGPILSSIGSVIFSPTGLLIAGIVAGVALIVTHWDEIKEAAGNVANWVGEKWEDVRKWTSEKWESISNTLSETWSNLKSWASEKFKSIKDTVSNAWEFAKEKTSSLWSSAKQTAGSIWDSMKNKASNIFTFIGNKVREAWSGTESNTSKSWSNSKRELENSLSGMDSISKNKMNYLKNTISNSMNNVQSIFVSKWKSISSTSTNAIGQMQSNVSSKMNSMRNSISSTMSQIVSSYNNQWNSMRNSTNNAVNSIANAFHSLPGKISSAMSGMYGIGRSAAQSFSNGFQSVYIPTPHMYISSWNSHRVGNNSFSTPDFNISWYAKGGFPAMGEMFIANEKGPELVGKMGRRNVVANNNQITSGIKAAVIEGIMEVFMATDGFGGGSQASQTIYVEVKTENDEVLARAVKRGNEKLDYRYNPSPAY